MITFDMAELHQASSSIKVRQALTLVGAALKVGFRLGEGDKEINILEFEGMKGVLVVDNADCQWGNYSFSEAVDLLNTGELKLCQVENFFLSDDGVLYFRSLDWVDSKKS